MPTDNTSHHATPFFQRIKPLQRIAIATIIAVLFTLMVECKGNPYFASLVIIDVFATVYLFLCWIVLLRMPISTIRRNASKEDGSKPVVFFMIIASSLAGLVSVLLMILNDDDSIPRYLFLTVCISGIILSWGIVHTVFTFHYAHLYYSGKSEGGLEFPGDEKPDYLDFAYFSFVIGCTFQVSDVEISYRKIRRLVFLHGMLAFMLNTFVVALSINIISGLLNDKDEKKHIKDQAPAAALHIHPCSQAPLPHSSILLHDCLFHTDQSV